MAIIRHTSVRRSFTSLLLTSNIVLLLLLTLGYSALDWISLRATLYDRLTAEAGIIGSNSIAALAFNDPDAAHNTLAHLRQEANIIAAALFTPDGQPFAAYEKQPSTLPLVLPSQERGEIGGHLYVTQAIALDGERIGTILLVSELNYWSYRRVQLGIAVMAMVLISLLVAHFLSRRLQRTVTEPILNLAGTAQRITRNQDYGLRAEKLSRDEIGGLVDDFNEMLVQIQLRDKELQHSREQLEEKVAERTWELTELTRQLEHQAYHDSLTGLPNRVTFDDHLRLAIHQAERYSNKLAVLFVDLDRFKIINDTLGHLVGDKLLIQAAARLQSCVRASDTLARLGGDEFAILLQQQQHENNTADIAHKLITAISQPYNVDGYSLHITASIGISVYPEDGTSAEVMVRNADTAMYRAKDKGKNCFTFFAADMNDRAVHRLELENKLHEAIDKSRFEVYYQPRLDTFSLDIIGVEALIRWFDPDAGEISPSEFIPLAEECGLAAQIDEWVLATACRDMSRWCNDSNRQLSLSVNFSPSQFLRHDLPELVARVLAETGFPGDCLEVEITEGLFGPNHSDVLPQLLGLRALGVEISIDDFGKAYSSLSRLKQLPLQTLKIDRFFVQDVGIDPDDDILVRTIIAMAHSLGLKVVAEGIETEAQYQFVKTYGCDAIQGFLYGKPMAAMAIKALLGCGKTA